MNKGKTMFQHDNLHFSLPNGDTLSVASLNGRYEVAILRGASPGGDFVPVTEWLHAGYDGDVYPIDNSAHTVASIFGAALRWAEGEKKRTIALALDQAL